MSEILNGPEEVSEIKLLPCPFCGGEAVVCNGSNEIVGNQYLIRCKGLNCTVRPKTEWYESLDEATRHWNTRKPIERIIERLEEKLEMHKSIRDGYEDSLGSVPRYVQDKAVEVCNKILNIVKEVGGIE